MQMLPYSYHLLFLSSRWNGRRRRRCCCHPLLLKSWCLLSFTISSFAWHVFSIVKEKCSRTLIVQVMDVMQAHLVFMKNNYLFYAWTSSSSHSWTENLFPWMLASGTLEIFQSDVIYNQIKADSFETKKVRLIPNWVVKNAYI